METFSLPLIYEQRFFHDIREIKIDPMVTMNRANCFDKIWDLEYFGGNGNNFSWKQIIFQKLHLSNLEAPESCPIIIICYLFLKNEFPCFSVWFFAHEISSKEHSRLKTEVPHIQ